MALVKRKCKQFQFRFGSIESLFFISKSSVDVEFQFRFGSIERAIEPQIKDLYLSFNSALVRLRVTAINSMMSYYGVSIPLWFD